MVKMLKSNLLTTTVLSNTNNVNLPNNTRKESSKFRTATIINERPASAPQGSAAVKRSTPLISIQRIVKVDALTRQQLQQIESAPEDFVTRHFPKQFLQSNVKGYYSFGTIEGYRPADNNLNGRFGDLQEGIQLENFHRPDHVYEDVKIAGTRFTNVAVFGDGPQIGLQYSVNDYCSCASRGSFSLDRAERLRNNGNEDIGAYVVYDLPRLKLALQEVLFEIREYSNLLVMTKSVRYGDKDLTWPIDGIYVHAETREPLQIWLDAAFTKSTAYQHEEELRILAIRLDSIGALPTGSGGITLNDPRIAATIVAQGEF